MQRRRLLSAAATVAAWPPVAALAAPAAGPLLAAAWDDGAGRHFAGVLALQPGTGLVPWRALELPTRAHGLEVDADGSLLVAARRPGLWLLRWHPQHAAASAHWHWLDADRRGCGHLVLAPGGALLCTETDLADGHGQLVLRDARTLALRAAWPTHGIDPHELLALPDGSWLVANGGVPTAPETGRVKLDLGTMDASLVRLDPQGRLQGRWRLPDPRLSLRHLARHADGTVAVALQAEHDDAAARAAAPLLALFDGRALHTVPATQHHGGYAGSVLATSDGFAIAATRAGTVLHLARRGAAPGLQPLPRACALAAAAGVVWAGGDAVAGTWKLPGGAGQIHAPGLQLDNHWRAWRAGVQRAAAVSGT